MTASLTSWTSDDEELCTIQSIIDEYVSNGLMAVVKNSDGEIAYVLTQKGKEYAEDLRNSDDG